MAVIRTPSTHTRIRPWAGKYIANCIWPLAIGCERICQSGAWLPLALVVGIVPAFLSMFTGLPGHQWATAVGLSVLCIGLAIRDRWRVALLSIILVFVSHSIVVVTSFPTEKSDIDRLLPKSAAYWEYQEAWIRSGQDNEKSIRSWLPAHAMLLAGSSFFSFTSLGVITFHEGIVQVDMMNYYNAKLAERSKSRWRSYTLGWHIWSITRGAGYVLLTFELISFSIQSFSGRLLSPISTRARRVIGGLGFLVADAVLKALVTQAVREQLFDNLN